MNVEVERWLHYSQSFDARFFLRFAKRRGGQVCISIDMTTRLQPLLQFRVEEKNESAGSLFNDES